MKFTEQERPQNAHAPLVIASRGEHVIGRTRLLLLVTAVVCTLPSCDRTPKPDEIEGDWRLSVESHQQFSLPGPQESRLSFRKSGSFEAVNAPTMMLGHGRPTDVFSAQGHWQVSTDRTATIVLVLRLPDGDHLTHLSLENAGLVAWIGDPDDRRGLRFDKLRGPL